MSTSAPHLHAPHTTSRAQPDLTGQVPWEQLIAQQAATQKLLEHHERLVELIAQLEEPAQVETIVLTPASPVAESREKVERPVLSVGILNPNNIPIYFSGVGTASSTTRSPSAPPNSLIVLPIRVAWIEVAANPTDLGANTAVCFLLRYFSVQPAFLGKGA